jgi:hypothetical protein
MSQDAIFSKHLPYNGAGFKKWARKGHFFNQTKDGIFVFLFVLRTRHKIVSRSRGYVIFFSCQEETEAVPQHLFEYGKHKKISILSADSVWILK